MIKITKIRDVKSPNKGTKFSSGIDFYVPRDLYEVKVTPLELGKETIVINFEHKGELKTGFLIKPGEGILIPSGIKMEIPVGFDLVFDNKSGVSVKKGLIIGAKVVDSDYRGEVHLHLINTSNIDQVIELGEKITQGIVRQVELVQIEEISEEEFSETERGEGGFGSTGNK